jgi:hypothetical protein
MFEKTLDVESFNDVIERLDYETKIMKATFDLAHRNLKRQEERLKQ